jgi:hypothetical protein
MRRRGGPPADPYFYRPDLDPANASYPGSWVYLVCLDPPIAHPELGPHASCSHYTGQSWDLPTRQAAHGTSDGARLLEYQRARGGTWHIARTWKGGRWEERGIKDWRNGPLLCPDHSPGNRRGQPADVARAAARAREQWKRTYGTRSATPAPDAPLPRLPASPPAELGRRAGERFLATREGWSADRIAAALAYVTGPYQANERHTERATQEMAAFTATVTAGIEVQRQQERAQAAPAAQPQEGTQEVSTNTAQDRAQEAREPTEYEKGAATARLIVLRQIEAGQSADQIAGRWEGALAEHDPDKATPEQQAWHDGAREEAAQLIQDWCDMQREEAEQAQAARDARDAAQLAVEHRASAARAAGEALAHGEPAGQLLANHEQAVRDERDAGGWQLTADELAGLDRQEAAPGPDREPEMEAAG